MGKENTTNHVSLMQTIAANIDNQLLSDAEFRTFIRNSIQGIKDLEELAEKHATPPQESTP